MSHRPDDEGIDVEGFRRVAEFAKQCAPEEWKAFLLEVDITEAEDELAELPPGAVH